MYDDDYDSKYLLRYKNVGNGLADPRMYKKHSFLSFGFVAYEQLLMLSVFNLVTVAN
jgi:hypothetical protein